MAPVNSEDFWNLRPGLLGFLDFLRIVATLVGYPLSGFGWLLFLLALPAVPVEYRLNGTSEIYHIYRFVGFLVVPGWLLLRFAAGLFPFGRCLFRWQRHQP